MKDPDRTVKHEREDRECDLLTEIARLERENRRIEDAWQDAEVRADTNMHRAAQAEKRVAELEKELRETQQILGTRDLKHKARIRALEATVAVFRTYFYTRHGLPEHCGCVACQQLALAGDGEKEQH